MSGEIAWLGAPPGGIDRWFSCAGCGAKERCAVPEGEDWTHFARCRDCGAIMEERRPYVSGAAEPGDKVAVNPDASFPRVMENFGDRPILVRSRAHYHDLLRRRGLRNSWTDGGASLGNWDEVGQRMTRPGKK